MSIKMHNVNYIYSRRTPFEYHALYDINLQINENSFTAIIGQTGSGKSTLIQHFNGLLLPTSGDVEVKNFRIVPKSKIKNVRFLRKEVGVVFQFPEYQLFEENVLKDVMFGPKNFGDNDEIAKEKAIKALEQVGIKTEYFNRSPFELSGGEKRRVAIAGIIAMNPSVLILDEPTAGLDPQGAQSLMELFKQIHRNGTTIVLVTHDMDLVLNYADEVIVMENGRIVENTKPVTLFSQADYFKYGLDTPWVFICAQKLIEKGLNIELEKIKNIQTLSEEIARARAKQ